MRFQDDLIYKLLQSTAWHMDAPRMYGAFHIAAAFVVVISAAFGALVVTRLYRLHGGNASTGNTGSDGALDGAHSANAGGIIRILAICGWILVAMEIYKQLFLYFIVNNGAYDWWYFPFQLCSVPMYLCILLPLLCGRNKSGQVFSTGKVLNAGKATGSGSAVLTFLATYTFVGAVAALAVPEDFMRSYVSLTLHGFIWHGMLLFISMTVVFSGMADLSCRGFLRSTALWAGLCVVAVIINVLTEPIMNASHAAGLVPNSYASMFYLNPFHISPQPIVDIVQKSAGIPVGLALYVIVIIAVSGLVALVFRRIQAVRQ